MACAVTRQRKPFLFLDSFATNSDDVVMNDNSLPRYVVLEKRVGETPLSCVEAYRVMHPELADIPLAYAGRLDPMASGKLLVLIGDECKRQGEYHGLDKEYEFSVLFGIESDTQDVLGRLQTCGKNSGDTLPLEAVRLGLAPRSAAEKGGLSPLFSDMTEGDVATVLSIICKSLLGPIELPYPHFSAKTVQGKPLHMWTLEGKLDEIEVPTRVSTIFELVPTKLEPLTRDHVCTLARAKIDTIPPVTDSRKALGNDFRRVDIRQDWERIKKDASLSETYMIAHFRCIASSGTYMRSLANLIARRLNTCGLAWHIHRTKIGRFNAQNSMWDLEY